MKKFLEDFGCWLVMSVAGGLITAVLNYQQWAVIAERGGLESYKASNPFWDSCIAFLFVWDLMYLFCVGITYFAIRECRDM